MYKQLREISDALTYPLSFRKDLLHAMTQMLSTLPRFHLVKSTAKVKYSKVAFSSSLLGLLPLF